MWPFRSDPAVKATGPLKEFYATRPPADNTPLEELPLLAVDVETTGLKPGKHQLVSIGWVPVDGTRIDLSGAGYVVLRGAEGFTVGSSATIHQLTDDQIAAGIDHTDAVGQLLRALTGRVLLGHFVAMEEGFLSLACERLFDAPLKVPMVDTFAIERRHMERMGTYPGGGPATRPRPPALRVAGLPQPQRAHRRAGVRGAVPGAPCHPADVHVEGRHGVSGRRAL